jgi:4-hydroxythreonine-4-phosphate dehydrogenase
MLSSKSGSDTGTVLALTPGEPAGIGPDIVLASHQRIEAPCIVVACPDMLGDRASQLGLDVTFNNFAATGNIVPGALNVLPVKTCAKVVAGKLDTANATYVLETLEQAVALCESGTCNAIVTGPVNKAVINDAGVVFSGHTEWLMERTRAPHVVMLLATEGLRVALVTTHLPLKDVSAAITVDTLETCILTLNKDMSEKFGIASPRTLVLGLNPHAGESGHLGREEIDVIVPVLERLRSEGLQLTGPLPADTAFGSRTADEHDVILAMYHDQGLPVLKFKGFHQAANITLGLPIIRTSVDHGTALDLAGSGSADAASLLYAANCALEMARNQVGS